MLAVLLGLEVVEVPQTVVNEVDTSSLLRIVIVSGRWLATTSGSLV